MVQRLYSPNPYVLRRLRSDHTIDTSSGRLDFTGHYSSTALHPVASYVARPDLQDQMKQRQHDTIEQRDRSSKILVVCGLGGAGKSQLTLQYIQNYRADYTAVFWIDAGSQTRLEADYKHIRNLLHSSKRTDVDVDTCVNEVKQWCHHQQGQWLFVFDSADDVDSPHSSTYIDLRKVVMDTPSADVIITTRSQSLTDMTDLDAVQVAEMSSMEARNLFIRRSKLPITSSDSQDQVDDIARELGFLALALTLAAAYVSVTPRLRRDLNKYLREYWQRRRTLLERKPKLHVDQYGTSVLATWESSYDAIFERCPEACRLLSFLAFLSPGDIFPELFEVKNGHIMNGHARWLLVDSTASSMQEVLDEAFEILATYSLIMWTDDRESYSMHKLVHDWSYERLDNKSKATFCEHALWFLQYSVRSGPLERDVKTRLISHTLACFDRACELSELEDMNKAIIFHVFPDLARFLVNMGEYRLVYDISSFLYEYGEQDDYDDPDLYFDVVNLVTFCLDHQGRWSESRDLLQPAFESARALYGPEDRITCNLARSLGGVFATHGKRREAEEMLRSAMKTSNDLDRLVATAELARVLMGQGGGIEAERLSRHALSGIEGLVGPMHRLTLAAMIILGRILTDSRQQHSEADAVLIPALHGCEITLGLRHPDTLDCMMYCGIVAARTGRHVEGGQLLRQVLSETEKVDGARHDRAIKCTMHLGHALRLQNTYDEALDFYQRAHKGYAASMGANHQITLYAFEQSASLRAFLEGRANLVDMSKQDSTLFTERLQADQHLQSQSTRRRHRAFTTSSSRSNIVRASVTGFDEWSDTRSVT